MDSYLTTCAKSLLKIVNKNVQAFAYKRNTTVAVYDNFLFGFIDRKKISIISRFFVILLFLVKSTLIRSAITVKSY